MFWAARALHWRGQRASRGRESSVIRNSRRAGARSLQLLIFNEEFLVSAIHQIALITSLPFVHTARRSYRLNGAVRRSDGLGSAVRCAPCPEVRRTLPFRGRRSRNKVSVGEPAEGSLPNASLRLRPENSCAGPAPSSFHRGWGAGPAQRLILRHPPLGAPGGVRRSARARRIQPRTHGRAPSCRQRGARTVPERESKARASAAEAAFFGTRRQLSTTDILAPATMKNAANCETWCDLRWT